MSLAIADNEWFVYSEGYGTIWTPKLVIQGRLPALSKLCDNARITPSEKVVLNTFLETTGAHAVGHTVVVVGTIGARSGQRTLDRKLTKVDMA